jgi:hypothetical protein
VEQLEAEDGSGCELVIELSPIEQYLRPFLNAFLECALDVDTGVHEAACSALAILEEEAEMHLVSFLPLIMKTLTAALETHRRSPILLDCLLPVVQGLGPGCEPYAQLVLANCMHIYSPEPQFGTGCIGSELVISFLDLVGGIVCALEARAEPMVTNSNLLALLIELLKDVDPGVQQSSFALIGDLADSCYAPLVLVLESLLQPAIDALESQENAVRNNASWAIGLLAIKAGKQVQPFAVTIISRLQPIVEAAPFSGPITSLIENACVAIGRLGAACPSTVAEPILNTNFGKHFCSIIPLIGDPTEKEDTCLGLAKMLDSLSLQRCVIQLLCDLLALDDVDLTIEALNGFENILKAGDTEAKSDGTGVNAMVARIKEVDGAAKLEQLREHADESIKKKAETICTKYSSDDAAAALVVAVEQDIEHRRALMSSLVQQVQSDDPKEQLEAATQLRQSLQLPASLVSIADWAYGPDDALEADTPLEVVAVRPALADGGIENGDDIAGKLALVTRGECSFVDKARRVQAAGAVGMVCANNDEAAPDAVFEMGQRASRYQW